MTFDKWWKQNGPFPEHMSRSFCERAWNAAIESISEPLPPVMLEALDITEEAVAAQAEAYVESEALALLRELNRCVGDPRPAPGSRGCAAG